MILNIPNTVTTLFISGDEVKDNCQSWLEENIRQENSGTDHTRAQGQKLSRITQQRMRRLVAFSLQTVFFKPLPLHLWIQDFYTNVPEKRRSLLMMVYNSHTELMLKFADTQGHQHWTHASLLPPRGTPKELLWRQEYTFLHSKNQNVNHCLTNSFSNERTSLSISCYILNLS